MDKLVGCPGGRVLGMYAVLLELCITLCLPFPQRGLLKLAMAPKVTVVQVKSKVGVGKTTQSKKTIGQTIVKKPSCQEEKTIGQTIVKQRQLKPARERGEYLKEWRKTRKATRTVASSVFRVRPFSLFFEQWMTDHPSEGNMSLTLAGKAWRAMSKHNKELWSQKAVGAMDKVKDHAMPSSQPASGDASVLGDDQAGGMTPGADAGQTAAGGQTRDTDVDKAAAGGQAPDTDFGRGTAGGEAPGTEEQPVPMTMRIHCGAYTAETTQQTRLGGGTYGTVYLGHHDSSGVPVAIKLFHFQGNPKVTECEIEVYEKTKLCGLEHPPFAKLFASSAAPFRTIVMEVFEHDLRSFMVARPHAPTLQEAKLVARQVLRGLTWLHQEYVHCDLKPANILWTTVGQRVALADFGCCQKIGTTFDYVCCTQNYRAPELWPSREAWAGRSVSPVVDVWSFGCTLWEYLMGGKLFFPAESKEQLKNCIEVFAAQHKKGSFDNWHRRIHRVGTWGKLIARCMKPIGKQRLSTQQLLDEVGKMSG